MVKLTRVYFWTCTGLLLACTMRAPNVEAEDRGIAVRIDPVKAAQLKRMEPLSKEKLRILLETGQLDAARYDLIVNHVDPQTGVLNLPEAHVGAETPRIANASLDASALPRRADGSLDVLAYIKIDDQRQLGLLPEAEQQHLSSRVQQFRGSGISESQAIKRDLKAAGQAAAPLVSKAYTDPIDLFIKADLWTALANARCPRTAGYIARTHQHAMDVASPVLIPYDKDVGGLILRRLSGRENPLEKWYSSRDLRDLIIDLEKSISHCAGVRAVTYLIDVYAARYESEIAPMRDKSRDRSRLVQACGGRKSDFDQDEPDKWSCSLSPVERALIGERLVPHLRSASGSVRQIAMNGLLVVLGIPDKDIKKKLEDAHKNWEAFERWWEQRREKILSFSAPRIAEP